MLVFLHSLALRTAVSAELRTIFTSVPWPALAPFLDALAKSEHMNDRMHTAVMETQFPIMDKDDVGILPEDHLLRGLVWTRDYFEAGWFERGVDEETRLLELPSTAKTRVERVLWLGVRLASVCPLRNRPCIHRLTFRVAV